MRTPFRDSERIAVQDAAEQRNLQNTELLSNCGSKDRIWYAGNA